MVISLDFTGLPLSCLRILTASQRTFCLRIKALKVIFSTSEVDLPNHFWQNSSKQIYNLLFYFLGWYVLYWLVVWQCVNPDCITLVSSGLKKCQKLIILLHKSVCKCVCEFYRQISKPVNPFPTSQSWVKSVHFQLIM